MQANPIWDAVPPVPIIMIHALTIFLTEFQCVERIMSGYHTKKNNARRSQNNFGTQLSRKTGALILDFALKTGLSITDFGLWIINYNPLE